MKVVKPLLLLLMLALQLPPVYGAQTLTSNTLTFETLFTALESDDSSAWEQLLKNKRLHHKLALLIADHLVELVEDESVESVVRLERFFNSIIHNKNERDTYLIRKSLLNLTNFKRLIAPFTSDRMPHTLEVDLPFILFKYFFVFSDNDYSSQTISDDHYKLIFLDKSNLAKNLTDFSYHCWVIIREIIVGRLLEESSSKRLITLQWIENHKNELDIEDCYLISTQLAKTIVIVDSLNLSPSCDNELKKFFFRFYTFTKHPKDNLIEAIVMKALAQKNNCSLPFDVPLETIHEQHLARTATLNSIVFLTPWIRCTKLSTMVRKINQKTKELCKDYYIFVHGQNIKYYALQQWYTQLRCLLEDRQPSPDYCYPWIVSLHSGDQERALHEELKKACCYSRSLFMNYALFGNLHSIGCSSAYYFFGNSNAVGSNKTADEFFKEIFTVLCLESVYEKYKERLEQHAATFDHLSESGNLLFIAVPKDKISQSVFLSFDNARQIGITIEAIGETDDIAVIMETLEKHPEKIENTDCLQFCLIMSQSPYGGGLNPESGIKIIPFNCIASEKLQAFEQEKAHLLAMMNDDIAKVQVGYNQPAEDLHDSYITTS